MMTENQYGLPLIVGNFADTTGARGLKRIRFEKGTEGGYNERWLQKLVSRFPSVLPIEQIEPALTPAIPICMELPLTSGFVDNLYATPDGDLIVGETKLFRNPEARREVVGQINPKLGLYDAVASGREEINEERFIDSVSRNLERGRFLLLVIGDGTIVSGLRSRSNSGADQRRGQVPDGDQ
jgi:hypothetical protein